MLENLSSKLTGIFIENKIISTDESEDFLYGMELLLLSILDFFIIFSIGFITGSMIEIFFFTLGFTPLRIYAGGYHAKTPLGCVSLYLVIVFVSIFMANLVIPYHYYWLSVPILLGISFVLLYKFAPVESINKPLSKEQHEHSRRYAFLIFFSQIVLITLMLSLHISSIWTIMMTLGIIAECGTLLLKERR